MKFIHLLQMMVVLLIFFELAKSVLGDEDKNKKQGPAAYALIFAYITVAIFSTLLITQALFDDHKKRYYLRMLPSWMRSNPHRTLQSGTLVEQSKARKGIYQFPGLQFPTQSRLNISEPLEHAQLNGCPMSGALCDPYRLPDLPIMEYLDAIMPSAPGKSCLLAELPMMGLPDVIQVWRIRGIPLPERIGCPPRASERELSGEVVPQETVIQRDTQHRLDEGRPQQTMNVLGTEPMVGGGHSLLPVFDVAVARLRHPRVFSTPPVRDSPDSEAERLARRHQRYPQDLERRIQQNHTDPALMMVRDSLENLMQELGRTRRTSQRQGRIVSRPPVIVQDLPVPENVRQANRLQSYIEGLERRIHDLRTEPTLGPVRGRLDSLMHELRGARIARDRLSPTASLRPAVPTAQGQLQNNQTNRLPNPIQNTAVGFEPRPRVMPETTVQGPDTAETMNSVDIHRLAAENLERVLRHLHSRWHILDAQTASAISELLRTSFQRLATGRNLAPADSVGPITQELLRNVQNINTSTPTIVTPQIRGEASRALVEGPAMDDNTNSNLTSEEEDFHEVGDRAVIEGSAGPTTDEASNSDLNSEKIPPETQHPIATALPQSVPDHDATLDQADPAAQRHVEFDDVIRAEATRQTATFYNEMDRSDPVLDVHAQDVHTDNGTGPTDTLHSPSSSPAPLPAPTATTTLAVPSATLSAQQLQDNLNEELYSDEW